MRKYTSQRFGGHRSSRTDMNGITTMVYEDNTDRIAPWAAPERVRKFRHDAWRMAGSIRDVALVVMAIAWQCGVVEMAIAWRAVFNRPTGVVDRERSA